MDRGERLLFATAFCPAVFLRALALGQFVGADVFSRELLPLVLRGFLSDAIVCFIWAAVARAVSDHRGWLTLWAFLWAWAYAGNHEHILYNGANVDFYFTKYGLTEDFIRGSVLVPSVFVKCALSLLAAWGAVAALSFYPKSVWPWTRSRAIPLAVAFCLPLLSSDGAYPAWLYAGWAETNLKRAFRDFTSRADVEAREDLPPALRRIYFSRDLSGRKIVARPDKRPNVLILILEGLGRSHFIRGWVPGLEAVASDGLFYGNFVDHQRQTNRGIYSLLCGDYPNLRDKEAKADLAAMFGPRHDCLPRILSEAGYATVFMQGADLGFMQKGGFAKSIGYGEILGTKNYRKAYSRTPWGVDDKSLFERTFEKISVLERSGKAWMVTVLTSGTHPPFNVPRSFLGHGGHAKAVEAFAYLDRSVSDFMKRLKAARDLENTLVLIVSDEVLESHEKGVAEDLSSNMAFLIALTPNGESGNINQLFAQSDLPLSVCDYLGIPREALLGRSFFRKYGRPRKTVFANVYTDKIFSLDSEGEIVACDSGFADCHAYFAQTPGTAIRRGEVSEEGVAELRQVVRYSDWNSRDLHASIVFEERNRARLSPVYLLGAHKVSVRAGERIRWRLKVRAEKNQPRIDVIMTAFRPVFGEDARDYIFKEETSLAPGETLEINRSYLAKSEDREIWTEVLLYSEGSARFFVEEMTILRG